MTKVYRSKVSYGLLIIVSLTFFVPIIIGFQDLETWTQSEFLLISGTVALYAFVFYLFFTTKYIIDGETLKIKVGFFNYKPVDIMSIREIAKSSNIISSPAASFDRIEVKYGKFDEIILSPKDKMSFVEELQKINPNIINKLKKEN